MKKLLLSLAVLSMCSGLVAANYKFTIYNETGKNLILDLGSKKTQLLSKKDKYVTNNFTGEIEFSLYKEKKGSQGDFFGGYTVTKAKDLTQKDKDNGLEYSIEIKKSGKKGFTVGPKLGYLDVIAQ